MTVFPNLMSASAIAIALALAPAAAGAAQAKDTASHGDKTKSHKDSKADKTAKGSSKTEKDSKGKATAQSAPLPAPKPSANAVPKPPAKPSASLKPASASAAPTPKPVSRAAETGSLAPRPAVAPKPTPTAARAAPAAAAAAAPAISASSNINSGDLGTLREAVRAAQSRQGSRALALAEQMSDPTAQKLVTWLVIRQDSGAMTYNQIAGFIQENPGWPTQSTLRRRAERVLSIDRPDPGTVRTFFTERPPISGEGKIALARTLAASGDTGQASALVKEAWREDELNEKLEGQVLEEFGAVLTRTDHKLRADRFSYKPDTERAMRAASRAGSDVVALTRARLAIARKEGNGASLLSQVPGNLSGDPAYLFAKSQLARRADRPQEAAQALLAGARGEAAAVDPDEWWIERRLVSRELLDAGDAATAYKVAATGPTPAANNYRAEQPFTAGWIALRYLKDPRAAAQQFAQIDDKQTHPITLSRGAYWQARAAEAMGDAGRARAFYEKSARFSTNYYGQLSRVQLSQSPVALRSSPSASWGSRSNFSKMDAVKAVRMLYAIGERDIPMTIFYDLAWRVEDSGELAMLYDLAEQNGDARGALVIGKESLAEGHPLDKEAFPTFGLPSYTPIGDPVDKAAVYAIARQESQFDPRTFSSAQAMGYMQVTPAAGQQVSKLTGVPYSAARLRSDQSYNVQFGAAELGELVRIYDGNYVLAFAAYNAGRGNVRKWIERYGDPRDPSVDVVDWVESIPFSETRNYVQRVMENYQVYKVLFNIPSKLQMEADLRGAR